MSRQLTLSASLSVLAMLGLALAGNAAASGESGLGLPHFPSIASACTPPALGELLPLLQPTLQ